MEGFVGGIGDRHLAERYRLSCRTLAVHAAATDREVGLLVRLGDVVADCRLAGTPGSEIDPTGALAGLDDDELAEWWLHGCGARTIVTAAADAGALEALDWMIQMMHFAELGATAEFGLALRTDLDDLLERVLSARTDSAGRHDLVPAAPRVAHDRPGWGPFTRPVAPLEHADRRRV